MVLSGLCVLLALGLLIAGALTQTLAQVYLSIATTLVGAVLVAAGVYSRRPGAARGWPGRRGR